MAHATHAAATHLFSKVFILQGQGKIRKGNIPRVLFCSTCVMFLYLFFRFFALFLVYLIAGILIKRYKMGVESVPEVIPNFEFWAGIPFLVKVN